MRLSKEQLDRLQEMITRDIAESDQDMCECCRCGASDLSVRGLDLIGQIARNTIISFLEMEAIDRSGYADRKGVDDGEG